MMCECDLRLAKELSKLYVSGDVELNDAYVSENDFDHATHRAVEELGNAVDSIQTEAFSTLTAKAVATIL